MSGRVLFLSGLRSCVRRSIGDFLRAYLCFLRSRPSVRRSGSFEDPGFGE